MMQVTLCVLALASTVAHDEPPVPDESDRASASQDDAHEERIRRLEEEVRRLREGKADNAGLEEPAEDSEDAWNQLTLGGAEFELYGFIRLDAIYDDSRMQNSEVPGWVLSEDPTAPPGVGAGGKNRNDFTMHARLTRLGINVAGPDLNSLGDPDLTGKIEIDFYNIGLNDSQSRSALRMRHAYLKLNWEDTTLLAGQTSDLISPLYPVVNNDLVMWGAGNLGDRRPQIRLDQRVHVSDDYTVLGQLMVGSTGAVDNANVDPAGTYGATYRDGVSSGLPTFQGRTALQADAYGQPLEAGVWGHWAREDPDITIAGNREFRSYAYGLDAKVPLYKDVVVFKCEGWVGKNVDDIRGGIFQGINTTTGEEVRSTGGFVELSWKAADWVTLYAGLSRDNPSNGDLNMGGRSSNRIWYLASRFKTGPVKCGLEYLNWTTRYIGFSDGTNNRVAGFISYTF